MNILNLNPSDVNIFHVSNKAIIIDLCPLHLYQFSLDNIVKEFLLNFKPPYINFNYVYINHFYDHAYFNNNFSSVFRKYNIFYFV